MKRGRTDGTVSAAVKATNKSQTFINKLKWVREQLLHVQLLSSAQASVDFTEKFRSKILAQ